MSRRMLFDGLILLLVVSRTLLSYCFILLYSILLLSFPLSLSFSLPLMTQMCQIRSDQIRPVLNSVTFSPLPLFIFSLLSIAVLLSLISIHCLSLLTMDLFLFIILVLFPFVLCLGCLDDESMD